MTVTADAPSSEGAAAAQPPEALALRGVTHTFRQGGASIEVLRGVDLAVQKGEIVALVGPSGSGKSTLLHIAGLLERPDRGDVLIGGSPAGELSDRARTRLRNSTLGFVYQFHHLLPEFSAVENIMLPQLIGAIPRRAARARANDLLQRFGLTNRARHRPARLSGGEQQRIAIARAVANAPAVLLADEPTGNLDAKTADIVLGELTELVQASGLAALVATHNQALAARMDRIVELQDGVLIEK
jgi:lipoprotein-releasing system ATP-binding protein